jgi:uncharacterized membrane protein YjjP (DUF1212 family)
MRRATPQPPDLGRVVQVSTIARAVAHGEVAPAEGTRQLAEVATRRRVRPLALVIGHGLAAAAAARFLGGAEREIGMAAIAGLVTGLLAAAVGRLPNVARIYEFSAAFVAAFTMAVLAALAGGFSASIATLAGLIVLIPGLTLTTAVVELATSHLTAGTTRMAGAFMTFIGIGFGVTVGTRLAAQLVGAAPALTPGSIAAAWNWAAVVVSAVAFMLLFRAERRDFGWIVLAGAVALYGTRLGSRVLGPELGAFVGSFAVGLGSNLYNRITLRPAVVTMVPGLLTLVPGSIGFRSVSALLESHVVVGIDTAFSMVLTAVSLVAGLLAATAIYPERRLA